MGITNPLLKSADCLSAFGWQISTSDYELSAYHDKRGLSNSIFIFSHCQVSENVSKSGVWLAPNVGGMKCWGLRGYETIN